MLVHHGFLANTKDARDFAELQSDTASSTKITYAILSTVRTMM
jgi:hypothetical protein